MDGGVALGVSKPTEMTIRDLLQEELRKRGVTVVPEFSVSTPVGLLKPDILLKNGARFREILLVARKNKETPK